MDLPSVQVTQSQCKGCQLCVSNCPKSCLVISENFNSLGYNPAEYTGQGCTGCGICYYMCPEPGAITVYKK